VGLPPNETVGNVYLGDRNLFPTAQDGLRLLSAREKQLHEELRLYAWLTLNNMTLVDLTRPSYLRSKGVQPPHVSSGSHAIIWREAEAKKLRYEPLLVDNHLLGRIDDIPPELR
jgi:hypothetical protein